MLSLSCSTVRILLVNGAGPEALLCFSLKHASGMRGSHIHMQENPVDTLAVAAGRPIVSEATLWQIWPLSVKTCRLVETRRNILRFVETRRHILGRARITTKNAAAEHFGSDFDQKSSIIL